MKEYLLCSMFIAFAIVSYSQAPNAFNYQAVIRNSDGTVKTNETVSIQISIIQGGVTGSSVYLEIHDTQTNDFGLVNLIVGEGITTDDLSNVDWSNGPYYLEITVNGVMLGASPLLSVPYALYAASGNEGPQGPQGETGLQGLPGPQGEHGDSIWNSVAEGINYESGRVGIGTASPTESLDVNGGLRVRGKLIVEGEVFIEDLLDRIQLLESMNGLGKMSDLHGNEYRTVRIGAQNWMAENLKVTQYADGSAILLVESPSWYYLENTDKAYCWNGNDSLIGCTYGALYTWAAAMNGLESSDANPSGIQGVCPDGWHLPSDAEWKELEMNLGMSQVEADGTGSRGTNQGGKLKETDTLHWDSPNNGATNESGFTALPGGHREIQFYSVGSSAYFWTATDKNSDSYAWRRNLLNSSDKITRFNSLKKYGFSVRCVEGDGLPVVTTSVIGNVTTNYAEGGGNVTSDGGAPVTAHGICWGLSSGPTVSGNKTKDGRGTGTFTSALEWLNPGTMYYVRAYATNRAGTGYGNEVTFTTSVEPVVPVVTASVTGIKETSVHLGGEVLNNGGTSIIAHGVCWSTSIGPAITDSKTTDGSGTGRFTSSPTGLTPATTYYIRAYATNSVGTGYGVEHSFTTLASDPLIDYDGNAYNRVRIGDQVWMVENMKSTHYADGSPIPLVEEIALWESLVYNDRAYCWYNNNASNGDIYGALYTWAAAMNGLESSDANPSGIQGVCPDGWHLPSDSEWQEMEISLGISEEEAGYSGRERGEFIGSKLMEVGTLHWESPNAVATNESGFTALPGGKRNQNGEFWGIGSRACFNTATESEHDSSCVWYRYLMEDSFGYIQRDYYGYKNAGYSVRCVKD